MAKRKNPWIVALIVLMIATVILGAVFWGRGTSEKTQQYAISVITPFGNIELNVASDVFLKSFDYADIVTVTCNGNTFDMPVCSSYTDVGPTKHLLLAQSGDNAVLSINYGQIAVETGVGYYNDAHDEFCFVETLQQPIKVTVSLKEKGGYSEQLALRQLEMGVAREGYPRLTDEEFANFRAVETTGIAQRRLYRSSSPIEPKYGRDTYAMAATEAAGIKTILNLTMSDQELQDYKSSHDNYYTSCDVFAKAMGVNYFSESYYSDLGSVYTYMAEHEGPYMVHCMLGKDRTGMCRAVLECLMGASAKEVIHDYMITYYNFYGIDAQKDSYDLIVKENLTLVLDTYFGLEGSGKSFTDDGAALPKLAENFLVNDLKLTPDIVAQLKERLG